jgi:glycerophosphoryl diester phosphodiesterase
LIRRGRRVLVFAVVLGALAGYTGVMARPRPDHPFFAPRPGDHKPLVLAHQGGEGEWPSNTQIGFEESVKRGADILDTDVHLSRDGVLVMIHDTTVDRTTDGSGAIAALTLAELQRLDAGYHFSQDGGKTYPFRGKGLQIPTLEWLLGTYPQKRLIVEIKETPVEAVDELARLLEKHGARERVIVGSFEPHLTYEVRKRCPGVATCATPSEARVFWLLSRLRLESFYSPAFDSLQVPPEHDGLQVVTRRFVEAAHRRGVHVLPWTLDTEEEMRSAMDMGVDGINTNYPTRMLELVGAHQTPGSKR